MGRTVGSDIELMGALEAYKGDLEWVMGFKEVRSTPVAAALIYSSQVSKPAAKFGQLLNDKVGLEKDSPVLTILRLLTVTRRGDVRQDIFLKTLNAQKAYVTKEKLPKLTASPEGYEYFRKLRLKAGLDTPTPK